MRPGVGIRVGRTRAREIVHKGEKIAPRRIAHRLGGAIAIDEVRAPEEGVAGTPSATPCASRSATSSDSRRAHARAPRFCIGVQTSRRLVVDLVRYPIFAADLHHLLLAGLPVYLNPKGLTAKSIKYSVPLILEFLWPNRIRTLGSRTG